jgi:hypothetical protein
MQQENAVFKILAKDASLAGNGKSDMLMIA